MTRNRSRTLLGFLASALLAAGSVTSSDAGPHGNRLSPTQSDPVYYHSDSDTRRVRDNACFSRSTGLPDQFACGSHGG